MMIMMMMMKFISVSVMVLMFASSSLAYNYVGCYEDANTRILEGTFTSASNMTVDYCAQICLDAGYYFAGVEYGSQCFCGNTSLDYTRLPDSQCSTSCSGDNSQKCGATWKLSLYTTCDYVYLGCHVDKSTRMLEGTLTTNNTGMTTEVCIQTCQKKGKRFALTEYSSQCFCGDHPRTYPKVAESECSYECTGNASQWCGGFWRGQLYILNYYGLTSY